MSSEPLSKEDLQALAEYFSVLIEIEQSHDM